MRIYIFFMLSFVLLNLPADVQASNLNNQSNLIDEGIEPAARPVQKIFGAIPVMDGLQIYRDPELVHLFSEDSGDRGDPVVTVGIVDVDDVYNFYKKILPEQGWQATSGRDYTQSGKTLHIDAHADGKKTVVTFTITEAKEN